MFGEKEKVHVYLGSDHAGFPVKAEIKAYIESQGFAVADLGCFSEESCDYPIIAREVSEKVLETSGSFGILICGSGVGMEMAANKLKGIRAGMANTEELAELMRQHNNANVLTMGARIMDVELMKKIAIKFLNTPFSTEARHVKRVQEMDDM